MSGDPTLRELLEVHAHFGLPSPALVEKDFHVVKALAALAAIDTVSLRLVFGGGTALSRAHRLIRRMSEGIDFRIVAQDQPVRGTLRRLRETVTPALLAARLQTTRARGDECEHGRMSASTESRNASITTAPVASIVSRNRFLFARPAADDCKRLYLMVTVMSWPHSARR